MTHFVLGVDPAAISGYALLDPSGTPIMWGQCGKKGRKNRCTGRDIQDVLIEVMQYTPLIMVTLAVEGQFLKDSAGRKGKDRAKAVSTLITARHAGMWIGLCQASGMRVYHHKGEPAIDSQVWRAAVWGGRWTTAQAKVYAVKMANHTWGCEILKSHDHEAEAIWIGKYVSDILRIEDRQKKLPI